MILHVSGYRALRCAALLIDDFAAGRACNMVSLGA